MSRIPSASYGSSKQPAEDQHLPASRLPAAGRKAPTPPPARSPHALRGPHLMTTPPRVGRQGAATAGAGSSSTTPSKRTGIPTPPSSVRMHTPMSTPPPMAAINHATPPTAASRSNLSSIPSAVGLQRTPLAATPEPDAATPPPAAAADGSTPLVPRQNLLFAFDDAAEIDVATPPCTMPTVPKITPAARLATAEAEAGQTAVNNLATVNQEEEEVVTSPAAARLDGKSALKQRAAPYVKQLKLHLHAAATCTMACSLGLLWVQELLRPINPHQTIFS